MTQRTPFNTAFKQQLKGIIKVIRLKSNIVRNVNFWSIRLKSNIVRNVNFWSFDTYWYFCCSL